MAGDGFHVVPAEGARIELEAPGMAAQEVEQPEAEACPLPHRLVAHPLVLAAVPPVVPLQDEVQHQAAAPWVEG